MSRVVAPAGMEPRFRLRARLLSFGHAGRGVRWMLATQHNAWIHLAATVGVVAAGLACRLAAMEWCAIVWCLGLVWTAEALNTALEFLADALKPAHDPLVGKAKDVAAGAVLLAAGCAALVGAIVFGRHLL